MVSSVKASFISLPELYGMLAEHARELTAMNAPAKQRDLREHHQKKTKEMHQAAMFARIMQAVHEVEPAHMYVGFPTDEHTDCDAILIWKKGGVVERLNVQLKELPPKHLASSVTLEQILDKVIRKLRRSSDIVVAVFVNQEGPARQLTIPEHNFAGVCAYGLSSLNPRRLFATGHIGSRVINTVVTLEF